MAKNKKLTAEEILVKMASVFAPTKAKKTARRNKVVSINGVLGTDLLTEKEAKKTAKRLATTDAVIKMYTYEGDLTVAVPVEVKATKRGE